MAMAREGALLALADINEAAVAETLSLLDEPSARHLTLRLDVTDETAVEDAVRAVRDFFGRPADVIVNSAGIMGPMTSLLDLDVKELRAAYRINVEVVQGPVVRAAPKKGIMSAHSFNAMFREFTLHFSILTEKVRILPCW